MNGLEVYCLSFPEASILYLQLSENLVINTETTFRILKIINPQFVLNIQDIISLKTINSNLEETEEFVFPILENFEYGEIIYSKIRPSLYQSEAINVYYEWVFIVSNEIPTGGFLTIYFPSNYYNLEESSPCPIITLNHGLKWIDAV